VICGRFGVSFLTPARSIRSETRFETPPALRTLERKTEHCEERPDGTDRRWEEIWKDGPGSWSNLIQCPRTNDKQREKEAEAGAARPNRPRSGGRVSPPQGRPPHYRRYRQFACHTESGGARTRAKVEIQDFWLLYKDYLSPSVRISCRDSILGIENRDRNSIPEWAFLC